MPRPHLLACCALLAAALAGPPGRCAAQAAAPQPRPIPAPAEPSRLDDILARGLLRVGTTGDYKPFTLRLPSSDKYVGLDIALAEDLARTLGVKLEIVQTTWGKLMPDLAAARFDLALGGISVTLERQKEAFFSIPMSRDGKTPITRCSEVSKY
jgi:cyclohexadienyl dehydratase